MSLRLIIAVAGIVTGAKPALAATFLPMDGFGPNSGLPWHSGCDLSGSLGPEAWNRLLGDEAPPRGGDVFLKYLSTKGTPAQHQAENWQELLDIDRYWPTAGEDTPLSKFMKTSGRRLIYSWPVVPTDHHTAKTEVGRNIFREILAGDHDEKYRQFARALRARLAPGGVAGWHWDKFTLRLGHEINDENAHYPFNMDAPDGANWGAAWARVRDLIAEQCPAISFSFCIFPGKSGGATHVLERFPALTKFDRIALDYGNMTTPEGPWSLAAFRKKSESWAAAGKPSGLDTWLQWAQANNKQIEFQEWGIGAKQPNNGAAILGYYELFWKWRDARTADGTKRVLAGEMIFRAGNLDLANGKHPDALWIYRRLWGRRGGVAPDYSHPLWDVRHDWKEGPPQNYRSF